MSPLLIEQHSERQKLNQARDVFEIRSDKRGVESYIYLCISFQWDHWVQFKVWAAFDTTFVTLSALSFDTRTKYNFLAIFSPTHWYPGSLKQLDRQASFIEWKKLLLQYPGKIDVIEMLLVEMLDAFDLLYVRLRLWCYAEDIENARWSKSPLIFYFKFFFTKLKGFLICYILICIVDLPF